MADLIVGLVQALFEALFWATGRLSVEPIRLAPPT
jgi:hypothetical protein